MEGIRKRLEFNNQLFQVQSVHALQRLSTAKLSSLSATGFQTTQEVPELDFLLKLCCHDNAVIATTAKQCMLAMIAKELVDLDGCMQQLLLLVSSTRISSLLSFLTDLVNRQILNDQLSNSDKQAHPLVKVYEHSPADTWQLIAVQFGNSLAAVRQSKSSDEQKDVWQRTLQYHSRLVMALLSSSNTKDGLLTSIFSTCLSFTEHLDYTVEFLTNLLKGSKNIQSECNILLLEIIWQQVSGTPRCLSDSNYDSLTRFSLAVMASIRSSSHRLWSLVTQHIISQDDFRGYQKLLSTIVKHHLNSDLRVLSNILSIVSKSIKEDKSMQSCILAVPLLELLSSLNICHLDNSLLLKEAEQCMLCIDNHCTVLASGTSAALPTPVYEQYTIQLGDPELLNCWQLGEILGDPVAALEYLSSIDTQIAAGGIVGQLSTYTAGAILVSALHTRVQLAAVSTLRSLVTAQPSEAPGLFLLIVHWMKRSLHPHVMMAALNVLPSFAAHKYNLPAVLKYLTGLADASQTRALALRLICDVTSVQSKAFPHLVQALSIYRHDTRESVMVAKAKAIYHICENRPTLYTTDILPDMNNILSTHHTQLQTVVALVIRSLEILVDAEVLDIASTWEVIVGHLGDIISSNRARVLSALCEFLALSSSLEDTTYHEFKEMSLNTLWKYTRHSEDLVVSAAYKSLAHFSYDSFKYCHLPQQIYKVYAADYTDNRDRYDSSAINAAALVDLMDSIPVAALPGYQLFIESMLVTEVNDLGIGLTRSHAAARSVNVPKAVQKIADRLNRSYNEVKVNRAGAVLSNLTVGMLFCQPTTKLKESPTNTEARQVFAASKRTLDQLFKFIRLATPLSLSHDWLFTRQLLVGWSTYIHHVLVTTIEGRKADMRISNQGGSQAELELIVRAKDQVEGVICTSAKHDATSQSNALIALSCLVQVTRGLLAECAIDESRLPTAYLKWESNVLCGLLSVVQCRLNSAKLPWFTAVGQALTYNVGVVCLGIVPYSVYKCNRELLLAVMSHLLHPLKDVVVGNSSDDGFYCGQTLGAILADLLNNRYLDVCDERMVSITEEATEFLYIHCHGRNAVDGCLLGFLELSPALLNSDSSHIEMVQHAFHWLKVDKPTNLYRYAQAVLAAQLYTTNRLEGSVKEEIIAIMEQPMTREIACGAGILVSTVCQEYHPKSEEWSKSLENSLLQLRESSVEVGKTANVDCCLRGLLYLTGALNYQVGGEQLSPSALTLSDKLAEALEAVTDKPEEYSWLSGSLYHLISSLNTTSHSRSNPQSYKHSLPTTSVLRYVVERLHSHTRDRMSATPDQLLLLVKCLMAGAERRQLPLLHWSSLLTPLMRVTGIAGEQIEAACLRIAVSQSQGCTLAAGFVSKCCLPQLYNKLCHKSHICMCGEMHRYIDSVENSRLVLFRDKVCMLMLKQDEQAVNDLLQALLKSLCKVVENASSHTPSSVAFVYEILRLFSQHFQTDKMHYMAAIEGVSQCLLSCEDTLTDHLFANLTNDVTLLHLSCRLVGRKCTMAVVVQHVERLANCCNRVWLLRSILPCWRSLPDSQALDIFVKIQTNISSSTDEEYVGVWLDILTTAVVCWAKGQQTFRHLNSILPFYISRLLLVKPWDQLNTQTLAWLDSLHTNHITKKWLSS